MNPPPIRGRWPRWILLVPVSAVLFSAAPWLGERMPDCLFHETTGLLCPGCGATRSAVALHGGDWGAAMRNNILVVSGLVLGGLWIVLAGAGEKFPGVGALRFFRFRLWFLWGILGALLVFALLRNIPAMEFLRPVSR